MTTLKNARSSVAVAMGGLLAGAIQPSQKRRRRTLYRETVGLLNQRSDRELEDLGFNRADIEKVARAATFN